MDLFRRTLNLIKSKKNLYSIVPYVLVGGGTASYYASTAIRARDPDARVLIISEEDESPYRRAPLSKELWWYGDEKSPSTLSYMSPATRKRRHICYESDGFYLEADELDQWEHGGVALMCGVKVDKIDADRNYVQLDNGRKIEFGKCLIATGSVPLHRELFKEHPELNEHISVIGDLQDYRKLSEKMEALNKCKGEGPKNIVIFGGGLLGSELAYSLNRRYSRDKEGQKLKVIQVASEQGILSDILPPNLSKHSTDILRSQGVELYLDTFIQSMTLKGNRILLNVSPIQADISNADGSGQLLCDHLILATGALPRIELAEKSGLKIDKKNGGILSDAFLHVRNNVWAAGDVCSFFDTVLGRQRRCAHWQHAQITGRIAGENMTNGSKTYMHQGAFVTMLGSTAHICGIGETDPHKLDTTTIVAANEPTREEMDEDELRAVVLYTDRKTKKINGALLYNVHGFGEEMARRLMNDMQPVKEGQVKEYGKLFEFWEALEASPGSKDKEIEEVLTESEVEAYQMRKD